MTKETFTVPAFEVEIERGTDPNPEYVCLDGFGYYVQHLKETIKGSNSPTFLLRVFMAALEHLGIPLQEDPKPGFTVRHEVDGEWQWTAVFSPSTGYRACWNVTDNCGNAAWHTRDEFAALCERDGVTL